MDIFPKFGVEKLSETFSVEIKFCKIEPGQFSGTVSACHQWDLSYGPWDRISPGYWVVVLFIKLKRFVESIPLSFVGDSSDQFFSIEAKTVRDELQ
jgi:hypothetical protein